MENKNVIQKLKSLPIYICEENKKIYFDDLVLSLKETGIKNGDILFVHVNLGAFGKLGLIRDRADIANLFVEALIECVGNEGTIISPTYTYSFCDKEIYDPQNTPSKAGFFSEAFRLRKDSLRTMNPIFSVSAIGARAKDLTTGLSKTCFGKGSIFDKLQNHTKAKYVVVGVDHFICSHVHYIEYLMRVPYRYVKKFKGEIIIKNKSYNEEYEYNVRHLNKNVITTFDKLEKHLLEKSLISRARLGWNYISTAEINDIFNEGITMLKSDPLFFLKEKPNLDFYEK